MTSDNNGLPSTNTVTRKWTEHEVDGLMFRLLLKAYRRDNTSCRFLIEHLRGELLKELT